MAQGTIKKLMERGFGFVRTNTGQEYFFHMRSWGGWHGN